jgi:hypothetical protein
MLAGWAVAVAAPAARAQDDAAVDPVEQAARLQLDAQVMSRQAVVCAERIPGYRKRFNAAQEAWKRRNARRLREGEAALRAESERANLDHEARMAGLSEPMALYLSGADEALRNRICEDNLRRLQRGREP